MGATYAILDVSPETYREIRERLETAAYDHTVGAADELLDMGGIVLRADSTLDKTSPARRPDAPPAWPPPPGPWPDPPEDAP